MMQTQGYLIHHGCAYSSATQDSSPVFWPEIEGGQLQGPYKHPAL
jgi:hypothetical protein